MTSEASVQRQVWIALARRATGRATLFRTNSGKAWLSGAGPARREPDGSVVVPSARPVALGLALIDGDTVPGLSDLTGWTEVLITPAMVGRTLPVATFIETKASAGGQRLKHQKEFIGRVRAIGGIADFASSVEMAHAIIDDWLAGFPRF